MQLSDTDRQLYRDAMATKRDADTIVQFVSHHLARVYKLPTGAMINSETGEVIVPEPVA